MKRKPFSHLVLFIVILLFASLACNAVTDILEEEPEPVVPQAPAPLERPAEAESQPATPLEQLPSDDTIFCPAVTDKILKAATEFYEEDSGDENTEEPEQLYLVTYSVSGDQISDPYFEDVSADLTSFQNDEASHQEIWDYFITLIPADERSSLAEYSIVTDGEENVLAAVAQTLYDPALWGLEVDIRDSDDKLNLTYTLIHEYAHLLTLGSDQVTPSVAVFNNPDDNDIYFEEVSACPDYFPGEGCSRPDSYINAFFDEFWTDIHAEWQDINLIEDDDAYYEALDDFYFTYEDRFVTDYAATNPEEDIAEAFTFFVLSPRPAGDTIAEEKILFFYDYPELVQLRDEIISGICSLNP
ncbi:MAG: hypothetical protein JW963_20980 [Anaerolineales bacterium]|nr:hypothetical protein [Anaerolineales bacterium]